MVLSPFFGRRTASAVFVFACLAATAPAQKAPELDAVQKIKTWGYQIRPIKGWNSMALDAEDRLSVGRWKLNVDEFKKRGDYEAYQAGGLCELKVVRIQPKVETPSGAAADASAPPKVDLGKFGERLEKLKNPKSVEEWIDGQWEDASKRWTREPLKGAKMQGELIEFGTGASAITIGYFRQYGVEWAVVYESFEEHYKRNWRDIYLKSLATFEVTENIDPDVAAAASKDPTKLKGEEKRKALKASIAGNPGWYSIDTKYYVILSNSKQKQFVESLAKELEIVREKVYTKNFPPRNNEVPLSPVRVLDTQSEYHQFGGPSGSAGYFSPATGELVLFTSFEDTTKKNSLAYCRSVMFHEAFHQYIHYSVGDVSPHSWFNEGHGDYYAGMTVAGGSIKFNPFDWRVEFLKDHLRGKRDLIPCRTLVRMPQREYYTNAGLKYSQGWALIYYLRNVSTNKSQKQALDTYFTYLADNVQAFRAKNQDKDGGPDGGGGIPGIPGIRNIDFADREKVDQILSEAVDKAFATVDFDQLDKDLRAWVEKL
jgi:hypothetical protein